MFFDFLDKSPRSELFKQALLKEQNYNLKMIQCLSIVFVFIVQKSGSMCLAIPGKVVELKHKGLVAVIDYGSTKAEANNAIELASVGEWVLVQQKVVVEKLTEEEAKKSIEAWKGLE